jgi:hypothetical protein
VRTLGVSNGVTVKAHKVVGYGPGGVGKSELFSLTGGLFIDIENSSQFLDVPRIYPAPETWEELRSVLHNLDLLRQYPAIIIDSLTKAEELAVAWTLQNVKHEKQGNIITSIESYGFGKGYQHVYETFLQLLCDLDAVVRAGVHVLCTAHDCVVTVPNPTGEDWIRYEPRLQSPPSGKGSIRNRVTEWTDHLIYIGFDRFVEDGKATSKFGTRTIYPSANPAWLAKSRKLADPIPYSKGSDTLWQQLLTKDA